MLPATSDTSPLAIVVKSSRNRRAGDAGLDRSPPEVITGLQCQHGRGHVVDRAAIIEAGLGAGRRRIDRQDASARRLDQAAVGADAAVVDDKVEAGAALRVDDPALSVDQRQRVIADRPRSRDRARIEQGHPRSIGGDAVLARIGENDARARLDLAVVFDSESREQHVAAGRRTDPEHPVAGKIDVGEQGRTVGDRDRSGIVDQAVDLVRRAHLGPQEALGRDGYIVEIEGCVIEDNRRALGRRLGDAAAYDVNAIQRQEP